MKRIEHGDMRHVLENAIADGVRVSSVVTDPPYGLGFMGKRWDGARNVAFELATWKLCYELLPPGGHLTAFGGTRTYHRLVCAIEDAGFEIRDQLAWIYGSGFPKSRNVAMAIDKEAGRPIERRPVGEPVKRMIPGADQHKNGWEKTNGREYQPGQFVPSDDAAPWEGWGTALKPAFEPIVLARKPLDGTVAGNVLAHGTGALNIDGCRITGEQWPSDGELNGGKSLHDYGDGLNNAGRSGSHSLGRWPANVVHDGSDEVVKAFPETGDGSFPSRRGGGGISTNGHAGQAGLPISRLDAGSAARFFYSAKADAGDRLGSKHPTIKPVDLMRWLVRLITPPGGVVLDPFAGSGSTAMACLAEGFDFIMVEQDADSIADIRRRVAHVSGADTPLFLGAK